MEVYVRNTDRDLFSLVDIPAYHLHTILNALFMYQDYCAEQMNKYEKEDDQYEWNKTRRDAIDKLVKGMVKAFEQGVYEAEVEL